MQRAGGNELGVGNRRAAAAFSAVVVTSLSLFVAAACTALVLCLRDRLSYLFTGGKAVASTSTSAPRYGARTDNDRNSCHLEKRFEL